MEHYFKNRDYIRVARLALSSLKRQETNESNSTDKLILKALKLSILTLFGNNLEILV